MLHLHQLTRRHVTPLMVFAWLALAVPARAEGPAPTPTAATIDTPPPSQPPPAEPPSPAPAAPAPAKEEVRRVVYLPESVKAQLREEIKQEVLAQAKLEGWAAPHLIPRWLERFSFSGDIRLRWERDLFPAGNANQGEFPDFNAINNNKPFDVAFADPSNQRYLDVDQDRTRPRMRARLATDVDVGSGFTAGVRLASGDSNTPVSANQTLGAYFEKYQFWLDRSFLRYQPVAGPDRSFLAEIGRFENPFFATELVWSDAVSFDGAAFKGSFTAGSGLRPFIAAGAFPLYTSALAFAPEQTSKFGSLNKWLYAVQLGTELGSAQGLGFKIGGAFYYFDKVEGRLSSPCATNLGYVSCDSDESRPSFAQKGNTYMALRTPNEQAKAAADAGLTPEYQFFGLASRFRVLDVTARVSAPAVPGILRLTVEGEALRNVGFSGKQIGPVALNNLGKCNAAGDCNGFAGGRDGYLARLSVGSPTQDHQWDWNAGLSYRHLESDAVLDAFDDSDFGLGGTNLKGYVFGAALALTDAVWASARWLSADSIAGPTYRADVLHIDVSARF